ncbi:MAG: MarR family transcriptional regulator [Saccharofermentans sp.]|nr:MarR family transcriptional regulator [Saccharofermentans sp.]
MITDSLKTAFGLDCEVSPIQVRSLPVYLKSGRKIYKLKIESYAFLLVELSSDDRFGISALKKQLIQYRDKTGLETAYVFKTLTKLQRDKLIGNHIPFICVPDQIYMPLIGVALLSRLKKDQEVITDKMMPVTQSLFLYLLYQKKEYVTKTEAAQALSVTKTSITRASEQLSAMGLIKDETVGKESRMMIVAQGRDLYEMAKKYLINPVQKTEYVSVNRILKLFLVAGESALSERSMLASPKIDCYAVCKSNGLIKQLDVVDPKWTTEKHYCQIELWKYDPKLFSDGQSVDIVSLIMSLSGENDERIQGALEEYLEAYKW